MIIIKRPVKNAIWDFKGCGLSCDTSWTIMQKMTTLWITWDAQNSGEKNWIPLSVIRTLEEEKEKYCFPPFRFSLLKKADSFKESSGGRPSINPSAAAYLSKEGRGLLRHLQILKTCCHSLIMVIIGEYDWNLNYWVERTGKHFDWAFGVPEW